MNHNESASANELREKAKDQIAFFGALEEKVGGGDLSKGERAALAFLVDDFERTEGEEWRRDLRTVIDKLEGEDASAATWMIAKEIFDRYKRYLEGVAKDGGDDVKKGVEVILGMMERNLTRQKTTHDSGKKVPLGGVSLDHVPEWYSIIS